MIDNVETAPVSVTLLDCERVAGFGRIRALASVALNVAGIEFEVHGIRVIEYGGTVSIGAPMFRGRRGDLLEAVTLPPELRRPLGALVAGAFAELGGQVDLTTEFSLPSKRGPK